MARQQPKAERESERGKSSFVFQRIRKKGLDPPNLLTLTVLQVGLALTQLQVGSIQSDRSRPGSVLGQKGDRHILGPQSSPFHAD